jgi:hypothetical protein
MWAFRAGWTATSSNESVQSTQPFIPGDKDYRTSFETSRRSTFFKFL